MSKDKMKLPATIIPINEEILQRVRLLTQRITELDVQRTNLIDGYAIGRNIDIRKYVVDIQKGFFELKEDG